MLQVVSDINPWAYRAFTPEECPAEVLKTLKFGESLNLYFIRSTGTYPYNDLFGKCPHDKIKPIMDKAIASNKWMYYPELAFNKVLFTMSECIGTDDSTAFLSKTMLNPQLINFNDSEEVLDYWQLEYPKIVIEESMKFIDTNGNFKLQQDANVPNITIPTVYYNKNENLIYNKVRKLHTNEVCVIPIFTSRHGAAVVVKAREECIVPLGTGRIRTWDAACELSRLPEYERIRNDHLAGVTSRYREYGSYEFNDKASLMNVLAQLPVDIVYSMNSIRK